MIILIGGHTVVGGQLCVVGGGAQVAGVAVLAVVEGARGRSAHRRRVAQPGHRLARSGWRPALQSLISTKLLQNPYIISTKFL